MPLGVPTGALRAPGSNGIAFAMQSFIDELAHAAGKDPLQFRLDLLANEQPAPPPTPPPAGGGRGGFQAPAFDGKRMRGVLELVRDVSGWGNARRCPRARAMGVAFHFIHRGYFAEVVQATVAQGWNGEGGQGVGRRRHRQPDHQPEQRRESGAGRGARRHRRSAGQEITIDNGRAVQTNFNTFPLLRMRQAPPVDVQFKVTEFPPTGLGRAGAAAGRAGAVQRDLRGDGEAGAFVAAVEDRISKWAMNLNS